MRSPGLQQGAILGEVLVEDQRLHLRCCHQPLQEPALHPHIEQPLMVLGERRRMPDRIIRAEADKRAKKQVVIELI